MKERYSKIEELWLSPHASSSDTTLAKNIRLNLKPRTFRLRSVLPTSNSPLSDTARGLNAEHQYSHVHDGDADFLHVALGFPTWLNFRLFSFFYINLSDLFVLAFRLLNAKKARAEGGLKIPDELQRMNS